MQDQVKEHYLSNIIMSADEARSVGATIVQRLHLAKVSPAHPDTPTHNCTCLYCLCGYMHSISLAAARPHLMNYTLCACNRLVDGQFDDAMYYKLLHAYCSI